MDFRPAHDRLRAERELRYTTRMAAMSAKQRRAWRLRLWVAGLVAVSVVLLAHLIAIWILWLWVGACLVHLAYRYSRRT